MTNVTRTDVKQAVDLLKKAIDENIAASNGLGSSLSDAQDSKSDFDSHVADTETAAQQAKALNDAAGDLATAAALDAIDANISTSNVRDICIYDTTQDPDGGAWRHRCAGTSWYQENLNTDTRGERREFPVVALIVAEKDRVVIYDADDPSIPMWMVFSKSGAPRNKGFFSSGTVRGIAAAGGFMTFGHNNSQNDDGGIRVVNFPADTLSRFTDATSLGGKGLRVSERGDAKELPSRIQSSELIYSRQVHDVAITVLPDAPVDPATKLPVPTFAAGTFSGVSYIMDDGTTWFWDETYANTYLTGNEDWSIITATRVEDPVITSYAGNDRFAFYHSGGGNCHTRIAVTDWRAPAKLLDVMSDTTNQKANFLLWDDGGLVLTDVNKDDLQKGLLAHITTDYTTGWLPMNKTEGAWLASTDPTDLDAAELLDNWQFERGGEGWSLGSNWSLQQGKLVSSGGGNSSYARLPFNFISGEVYRAEVDITKRGDQDLRLFVGANDEQALGPFFNETAVFERYLCAEDNYSELSLETNAHGIFDVHHLSLKRMEQGAEQVTNGVFDAWTDATIPDGWDKDGTHDGTNNYVEQVAGGLRMVSDGTFIQISQDIEESIIGQPALIEIRGVSITDGGALLTGITPEDVSIHDDGDYAFVVDQADFNRVSIKRDHTLSAPYDFTIGEISVRPLTVTDNRVVNGNFERGLHGWTDDSTGTGSVEAIPGGVRLHTDSSGDRGALLTTATTVPGKQYKLRFEYTDRVDGSLAGGYKINNVGPSNGVDVGVHEAFFTATGFQAEIKIYGPQYVGTMNVGLVEFIPLDADRSVNQQGLQIVGQVQRERVAEGSELVYYAVSDSGSYLEQPYNPALDFGTGDFSILFWLRSKFDPDLIIRESADKTFILGMFGDGRAKGTIPVIDLGDGVASNGEWNLVAISRKDGILTGFGNGQQGQSKPYTDDLTDPDGVLRIEPGVNGKADLALLRFSATALTAEQIARIYEDERHLFQPGAKCTLAGNRDAVNALAVDDGNLHVTTPDGRSSFRGLVRYDHNPAATGKIAASGGMIVEE